MNGSRGPRTIAQQLRLLLLRAMAWLGSMCLLGVLLTGTAGWYTSRSQFCNSCHIMEPYYVSWQESTHRDVSCVKCHFPPGVGEKVRGKLLGLVQLVKYVTATQGPRPSAEVPDASCLRSGCHETRLLSGRVDFHGIPFDHRPHLEQVQRGKELRCTSCHSQIVQGTHMTVTASTCYLCHFKGLFFNQGLGACTRCHQIPEREYELGGGVKFHHELAYTNGVDCASCHGDLIRGSGEVPTERCGVCHNRQDDLNRYQDAVFMHQTHVTEHKVDCLACHLQIQHSLDPNKLATAASNCTSCHPNQHREAVSMLQGTGSRTLPGHPSNMAAVRIACPACHQVKEVSSTGTVLVKATLQTCAACHEESELTALETYHVQLKEVITKLIPDLERIRQALDPADLPPDRKATLAAQLQDLQHDVDFLRAGNDIHNSHYAHALSGAIVEKLTAVCHELNVKPPDVTLPDRPTAAETPAKVSPGKTPAVEQPGRKEPETKKPTAEKLATEKPQPAEEKPVSQKPSN